MARHKHHHSVLHSKTLFGFVTIVALVFAAAAGYFYTKYTVESSDPKVLSARTSNDNDALIEAVGKLIELPAGEKPSIATVTDKTKVQRTDFFRHAENGDKVLSYPQASLIILYRPSLNKIIQTGPAVFQPPVTSETPKPSLSPSAAPTTAAASSSAATQ